jgi:ankyrin repeat protein
MNALTYLNRLTNVFLVVLACSIPVVCGEIHDAAKAGNLAKAKTLLKNNPNLINSKDDEGETPLHWAAMEGHKDMAVFLLTNKADVNARDKAGDTPLHWAAMEGYKDVMELLLASKANVNARDNAGETPLLKAVWGGMMTFWGATHTGYKTYAQKDVVALLLSKGADINAKTNDGLTSLHMAVEFDHKDLVEMLRQHGGHE